MCNSVINQLTCSIPVTCVEFEFSEYTVLESVGLLNVTLLLMGKTQSTLFNVIVIANDTGSSSAIGKNSVHSNTCNN